MNRIFNFSRFSGIVFICLIFSFSELLAADRTVCGAIMFRDIRQNCDGCGNPEDIVGLINPCGQATYQYAGYVQVEVWDYDPGSNEDEFIGAWRVNGYGPFCITFPWEGEDYQLGEANPDPYFSITWDYGVPGKGWIYVRDFPNEDRPASVSWPGNHYLDCPSGSICWLSNVNYISTSATSDETQMANIADSALHATNVFGGAASPFRMPDATILYCDEGDCEPCEEGEERLRDGCGCRTLLSGWGYNPIWLPYHDADDPYAVCHEQGHLLSSHLFEGNGPGVYDYRKNGQNGHGFETSEYDKVATFEGWANYVAIRSWWDSENINSSPCWAGRHFEPNSLVHSDTGDSCEDNRGIEILVAKGFWDMDDASIDCSFPPALSRCDNLNLDTRTQIVAAWNAFSDGTSNRQEQEADVNGTNLFDYWYNASFQSTVWSTAESTAVQTVLMTMTCQNTMDVN